MRVSDREKHTGWGRLNGCNSRVKYVKNCPIHGELSSDQIVSGYEYAKDQYVIIDTAELDKLRTEDD